MASPSSNLAAPRQYKMMMASAKPSRRNLPWCAGLALPATVCWCLALLPAEWTDTGDLSQLGESALAMRLNHGCLVVGHLPDRSAKQRFVHQLRAWRACHPSENLGHVHTPPAVERFWDERLALFRGVKRARWYAFQLIDWGRGAAVAVAFWAIATALSVLYLPLIRTIARAHPFRRGRSEDMCSHCGYSLWGLTEPRCPECGTPFDPSLLTSQASDVRQSK